MSINLNILKSRIGTKMLLLFLTATLLPIGMVSLISYYHITNYLHSQSQQQLLAAQQHFTNMTRDRLRLLASEFKTLSLSPDAKDLLGTDEPEHVREFFSAIALILPTHLSVAYIGVLPGPITLEQKQLDELRAGKKLLVSYLFNHERVLYLLKQTPEGILAAQINKNYLWGNLGKTLDGIHACVLNQEQNPIFCSPGAPEMAPAIFKSRVITNAQGEFNDVIDEQKYTFQYDLISFTGSLAPNYWTALLIKSDHGVWEPIRELVQTFPLILIASLLLVFMLSRIQIRRVIRPLNSLAEGTRNVANQNFQTEVLINTGDEFQELGDSFNRMINRIGKQFNALETMARIDRLILSTLDLDNIIETILVRMDRIVPCDTVSIVITDESAPTSGRLYYRSDSLSTTVSSLPVSLSNKEIKLLEDNPDSLLVENNNIALRFLRPLKINHQAFLLLPIFLQGRLSAVIILGYHNKPNYVPEDLIHARDLAHRVAVALSNATWEDKLYHKAHYDSLTGLPNRLLFQDRLQYAITRAQREKNLVALMFIDLDRFKFINDSLGHDVGDEFLKETAIRLRGCVRSVDTVARLGGDEFTIIVPDLRDSEETVADLTSIVHKVLGAIVNPYYLDGQEVNSSASIGIAIYPRDADNYTDLMKNADSAMYFAKMRGSNNYQFYSEDLNAEAKSILVLENQLHHALKNNEFELFFQPRMSVKTGHAVNAEALIRWRHPEKGLVSPNSFISIAEENGLILKIGEWALRHACVKAKEIHAQGFESVKIAVNISPMQFRSQKIVQLVKSALEQAQLSPEALEIEITETTLMQDIELTIATLKELHQMKVNVSIDDFGMGYSSLNFLKTFPINTLKIDRTFIHNMTIDKQNNSIVAAIIHLAHCLDLTVVAEGVEAEPELHRLIELDCDEIQGFLFSKPLPLDEFVEFLRAHHSTHPAISPLISPVRTSAKEDDKPNEAAEG